MKNFKEVDKTTALNKIHTGAKVARIITIILNVLLGIAAAALVIGMIVMLCLPKNLIELETKSSVNLNVNIGTLIEKFGGDGAELPTSEELMKQIQESGGNVSINGIADAELTNIGFDENGNLNLSSDVETRDLNLCSVAITGMAVGLIYVILTFVFFVFVRRFCLAMEKSDSPFSEEVINTLRNVAFALIPWAVISSVCDSLSGIMMGLTNDVSITVNTGVIICAVLLLGLAYIFGYGAVLQRESDETL